MAKSQRTLPDFLAELEAQNMSLADWARGNNFTLSAVYAVIAGRNIGKRGEGRLVRLAMGLSVPPMHTNLALGKGVGVAA